MSDGYMSRGRDIRPPIDTAFLKLQKWPLNYQVEQYLRLLNSHICLEFLSLPGTFNFFREFVRWLQVKSAAHVFTRLIWLESTD